MSHLPNDAKLSQDFAAQLLNKGICVTGSCPPRDAKGNARIRVQISTAHSTADIDFAIDMLCKKGHKHGTI